MKVLGASPRHTVPRAPPNVSLTSMHSSTPVIVGSEKETVAVPVEVGRTAGGAVAVLIVGVVLQRSGGGVGAGGSIRQAEAVSAVQRAPATSVYGKVTPQSTSAGPTPDTRSETALIVASIGAGLCTVMLPDTAQSLSV